MFCPYCGHRISGETVFCGKCGRRLSTSTSAKITDKWHCRISKRLYSYKKIVSGVIVLALVSGLAFAGYSALDSYFLKDQQTIFVSTENGCEVISLDSNGNVRNRVSLGTSEDADAAKLLSFDDVKYSSDKKYMYYRTCIDENNCGTLYRAELSKLKKDPAKNTRFIKRIATDVADDYELVGADGVIYRDSAGCLYDYQIGQTIYMGKNVTSFCTDGGERVVYRTEDGILRSVSLKSPKKHTTITENAGYMICFSNVDHIIYAADRWQRPSEIYTVGYGQKPSHPNGFSSWDQSKILYYSPERKVYALSSATTDMSAIVQFDENGITTISDQALCLSTGDLLWYIPKDICEMANNGNEYYIKIYDCYHEETGRIDVAAGESIGFYEMNVYGGGIIGSWIYVDSSAGLEAVRIKLENGEFTIGEEWEGIECENAEVVGKSENALYYVTNYTDEYVADFHIIENGVDRCIAEQIDVASVRAYEDGTVLYYDENSGALIRVYPDGTISTPPCELYSCELMKDGSFLYLTDDGVLYWEKENITKKIAEGQNITVLGDAIQEPIVDTARYYF